MRQGNERKGEIAEIELERDRKRGEVSEIGARMKTEESKVTDGWEKGRERVGREWVRSEQGGVKY